MVKALADRLAEVIIHHISFVFCDTAGCVVVSQTVCFSIFRWGQWMRYLWLSLKTKTKGLDQKIHI